MAFNLSQLFTGVPSRIEKLPIQEPLQQGGINQLFQQGLQDFNPANVENYARQQFHDQTIPSISERFTASTGGRTSSPQFGSQLGAAGAGLEGQLANLRYGHGLNALKLGLTPQYEYMYRGEQPGLLEEGARGLATSAAQALPGLAQKGAAYLFGGGAPGQPSAGQQAAQGLAEGAIGALGSIPAGPTPGAPQMAGAGSLLQQGAGTLAGQQLAAKAGALAKQQGGTAVQALQAATPAAAGAAGALTPAAASVNPIASATPFIDTAAAVAKYGIIGAGAAVIAKGIYEMISETLADRKFPVERPYPANFQEMTGPERAQTQLARQVTTPGGQITEADIITMERAAGITPKPDESLQDRYNAVLAKKGK